jgi:hypothetical protein
MKKSINLILAITSVVCFCLGCSGVGQFTPPAVTVANNAITVAQGLLHSLDSFYGDLITLKTAPDYRQTATKALAIADVAAASLRQIINGASATDAQLNIVAGQVAGAKAILAGVK